MLKVLVTGANGFVGKACLRALENKEFAVHGLCRDKVISENAKKNITWHNCDLLNYLDVSQIVQKIQPDFLIHLAWFVDHNLFWHSEKNIPYVDATVHLYEEFSRQGGKKAVFVGSCAEYDAACDVCEEDKTPLLPQTLYGTSKKQTYELLSQIKRDNINYASFCWVRLFNIFGSHENPNRLIPYIIRTYLHGDIPQLNSPLAIRDHLYVDNLGVVLVDLLTNDLVGAINIGQGNALSVSELANIIHARYFWRLAKPIHAMDSQNQNKFLPSLKKLYEADIVFPYNFDQGLERVFNWWVSQQN